MAHMYRKKEISRGKEEKKKRKRISKRQGIIWYPTPCGF